MPASYTGKTLFIVSLLPSSADYVILPILSAQINCVEHDSI